jgi:hypothetical protein
MRKNLTYSLIGFMALWPVVAHAGFDFIPPSTPSKTAPIEQVERVPLAPPAGMNASESRVPVSAPTPIIPQGMDRPAYAAPVAQPLPPSGTDYRAMTPNAEPAPVMAAPVPRDTPAPMLGALLGGSDRPTRFEAPRSAYPPINNAPARPLTGTRLAPAEAPIARTLPPMPRSVVAETVVTPAPTPTVPMTMPEPKAAPTTIANDATAVLEGFGQNLPLSLALSQIVPQDYTVVYQAQPDADKQVSWVGGRPWAKVLEDMIFAHGYRVTVTTDNQVIISAVGQPLAPIAAAPAAAMPSPSTAPTAPLSFADNRYNQAPAREVTERIPVPAMPVAATSSLEPVMNTVPVDAVAGNTYDPAKIDLYSGRTGEPVRAVLTRWGRLSGVAVDWRLGQDLTMPQSFAINAPYARAVDRLLALFAGASPAPVAQIDTSMGASPRLIVSAQAALRRSAATSPGFSFQ